MIPLRNIAGLALVSLVSGSDLAQAATCADVYNSYLRQRRNAAAFASSDGLAGNAHRTGKVACARGTSGGVGAAKTEALQRCNGVSAKFHLGQCSIVATHM